MFQKFLNLLYRITCLNNLQGNTLSLMRCVSLHETELWHRSYIVLFSEFTQRGTLLMLFIGYNSSQKTRTEKCLRVCISLNFQDFGISPLMMQTHIYFMKNPIEQFFESMWIVLITLYNTLVQLASIHLTWLVWFLAVSFWVECCNVNQIIVRYVQSLNAEKMRHPSAVRTLPHHYAR